MEKRSKFQSPMVGGSSLLVIFAVLCLTVFALLGFSTVQADKRLADASLKAVTDYYAADCKAETILAQLRSGNVPEGVVQSDDTYRYSCPVSDTQMLVCHVRVQSPDNWQVLRWQTVSTAQWDEEAFIQVWSGDTEEDF